MTAELSADDRGLPNGPLRFLPNALLEARSPAAAVLTGWLTAFIPSIALAAIVTLLLPSSAQPQFNLSGARALFLLVVFAPVLETIIMGSVLLVLLRLAGPTAAALISSAGWGIAHSLVAPAWGLVIWWPFLVFSTLFVAWRPRSLLAAFAIPAIVHGLHNLPSALLVAYDLGV